MIGLAIGITYGSYSSGGVFFAGLTGLICLAALIILALGLIGKFRATDETGFPMVSTMALLICAGLLIIIIPLGVGVASLQKSNPAGMAKGPVPLVAATSAPVVSSSATPVPSVAPVPNTAASPKVVASDELKASDFGLSPTALAILVALAVLAVLILIIIILRSGDATWFGR